eukprot:7304647-Alexandrium_andersonii.AAC.1
MRQCSELRSDWQRRRIHQEGQLETAGTNMIERRYSASAKSEGGKPNEGSQSAVDSQPRPVP